MDQFPSDVVEISDAERSELELTAALDEAKARLHFVREQRDEAIADNVFLRNTLKQLRELAERATQGSELERQLAASLLVRQVTRLSCGLPSLFSAADFREPEVLP